MNNITKYINSIFCVFVTNIIKNDFNLFYHKVYKCEKNKSAYIFINTTYYFVLGF